MIFAIDFDGCLCENRYPEIGRPKKYMIKYCKQLKKAGHELILWTCREGNELSEAVKWCSDYGLTFDAVNDNLPRIIEEFGGSNSRKIFADAYYDDRSLKTKYYLDAYISPLIKHNTLNITNK